METVLDWSTVFPRTGICDPRVNLSNSYLIWIQYSWPSKEQSNYKI